jgi:molybdopterin-guanine dinucleotide biosynthesis protein A
MGTPKALLDWHGAPLVHRVAAILARACDPVVVVAAPGQELPLPAGVEVAEDAVAGRGPLEGVAAGMLAVGGRAGAVFLAATDLPLLHPQAVSELISALPGYDAAVPVAAGHDQTLAAAYDARTLLRARELLAAGRPRIAALLDGARVARLPVSRLSHPHAVRNANTPEEYERLLGLPEPAVRVVAGGAAPAQVEAATVARAVARIRPDADVHRIAARVNGLPADGMTPLVAGDLVELPSSPPSR